MLLRKDEKNGQGQTKLTSFYNPYLMHFYYRNNFVTKQNVKKEGKYTQQKCTLTLHLNLA